MRQALSISFLFQLPENLAEDSQPDLGIASGKVQPADQAAKTETGVMDKVAEEYVKLVLALGQHDADYVDAYYGPPAWKTAAETTKVGLDAIAARANDVMAELGRERRSGEGHVGQAAAEFLGNDRHLHGRSQRLARIAFAALMREGSMRSAAAPTARAVEPAMQRSPAQPKAAVERLSTVLATSASGITTM